MYHQHFGFNEAPFSIAPNPRYLFLSERHREALAHLLYGLSGNGGFILLTGEVGTGKTTVCRCLLEQLPDNTDVAFVLNPRLSVLELLATVCDEFGLDYAGKTPSSKLFVDLLSQFLLDSHANGRQALLIIDEAQNLGFEVLEELRLLTNLETHSRKLLQILLLGQPELQQLLRETRLRQLNQRVIARYHLQPLSRAELAAYVPHRLRLAGGQDRLIPPRLFNALFAYSQGVPRLINLICDRSLLGAYAAGQPQVSAQIMRQAAVEVLGEQPGIWARLAWLPWRSWALAVGALALLLGLAFWLSLIWPKAEPVNALPLAEPVPVQAPVPNPAPPSLEPKASVTQTEINRAVPEAPAQALWPPVAAQVEPQRVWQHLFQQWKLNWAGDNNPCDWALYQNLYCVRYQGDWNLLRQYNRPALLSLKQGTESFNLLLLSLSAERAQVQWQQQPLDISLSQLQALWTGEFSLLLPQIPLKSRLLPGERGPVVRWLDTELARHLNLAALQTDLFDTELESRIRQFQAQQGLMVDGIIGNQTLQLLAAKDKQGPVLNQGGQH